MKMSLVRGTLLSLVSCMLLVAPSLAGEKTAYGAPLGDSEKVPIAELVADPDRFVGKTIQVEGRITDVCPRRGCWIDITAADKSDSVRFKVEDGVIVFPKEVVGHDIVAEGVFTKIEMTKEQAIARAQHLAEVKGRTFDPESEEAPLVVYQLQGLGARIH